MDPPAALDHYLAAHDGVADIDVARSIGLTDRDLRRLARAGAIRLQGRRAVVAARCRTARAPARIATLNCGTAVVSYATAAAIWEMDGFDGGRADVRQSLQRPSVSVRPGDRVPAGTTAHRTDDLEARDIGFRNGLPLTDVTRTLCDLGAVVPAARVERAVEWALRTDAVIEADLWRRMARLRRRGKQGPDVLGRILARRGYGTVPTASDAETMFVIAARCPGRPDPVRQWPVDPEFGRFRVDFAYNWPTLPRPVWVEIDGFASHSSPSALQYDLQRQNALMRHQPVLLRFTASDVYERHAYVRQETWHHLGLRLRPGR